MNHVSSHPSHLEQRIRALESSNRRHRLAALGLGLLAVVGCFGDGDRLPTITAVAPPAVAGMTIEADAFLLRDGAGGTAARLELWNGHPRLVLYSAPQVEGVVLRTEPRSSELRLDAAGKRRTHLEAGADLNIGRISLTDDAGRVMAQIQTEGGATTSTLWGGANQKGVRAMLNLLMPPVGPPEISLRDAELKSKVILLEQ